MPLWMDIFIRPYCIPPHLLKCVIMMRQYKTAEGYWLGAGRGRDVRGMPGNLKPSIANTHTAYINTRPGVTCVIHVFAEIRPQVITQIPLVHNIL
jgi:hypothetical protein